MTEVATHVVSTGVEGLDTVLHGGFPGNRLHLVQGSVGTGKTTFGLQFAPAGVRNGKECDLADTVALLRSLEHAGRVRKTRTVYERRASMHEKTVRELPLAPGRIGIGEILGVHDFPCDLPEPEAEPPEDAGRGASGGR